MRRARFIVAASAAVATLPAFAATEEAVTKVFERLRERYGDGTMTVSFRFLAGVARVARNEDYLADARRLGWDTEHKEVTTFLETFDYGDARSSVAVVQLRFAGSPKVCYKRADDLTAGFSCKDWSAATVAAMAVFFETIRTNTGRFTEAYARAGSLGKKYKLMSSTTLEKNFVLPHAISESKVKFLEEALKPGALDAFKAESPADYKQAVEWIRSTDLAAYKALGQLKVAPTADRLTFSIEKSVYQVEPRQIQDWLKKAPPPTAPLGKGVGWFFEASRGGSSQTPAVDVLQSAKEQIINSTKFPGQTQ